MADRAPRVETIALLFEELGKIRTDLAELRATAFQSASLQPARVASSPDELTDAFLLKIARGIVRLRAERRRHFRANLFAEPAWDMLLDLFIAHLEGRRIYVSSLCIASNVPATTALRYIKTLEENGDVVCTPDPGDHRRRWLGLSDAALTAMRATLSRVTRDRNSDARRVLN